jgi:hypothetical protein
MKERKWQVELSVAVCCACTRRFIARTKLRGNFGARDTAIARENILFPRWFGASAGGAREGSRAAKKRLKRNGESFRASVGDALKSTPVLPSPPMGSSKQMLWLVGYLEAGVTGVGSRVPTMNILKMFYI